MAEDNINSQEPTGSVANRTPGSQSSEELAACDRLVEALGKIDLSEAFKAAGLSIETTTDGSLQLKHPEGEDGLSADEILARGFLPPGAEEDSLPANSDNGENDMGLLDKFRICICSEVTGIITKDGKPVEGAEIIRRLDLYLPQDQVYTDKTVTDANGRFTFEPAYSKKSKYSTVAVAIDQKILVKHEGKLYLGWGNISSGRELHEEYPTPRNLEAPGYHPLDFDGDISRATPLPEDVDLNQPLRGKGFFNSQIVCVASRLHFFVTMKGELAAGAKIVRTAEHIGHHSYEQIKTSDMDGEVNMDPIFAARLVPAWEKTEIKQKIVILYEGKEYLAWEKTKTNPWEEGEYNLDDKRQLFSAEITAELSDDPNAIQGVKTDIERCWKGEQGEDYLPPDAIQYKGLFQIIRYSQNIQKD